MISNDMTTAQAAAYLRLRRETVARKARRGELPAAKAGRRWRFRKPDLDTWMSETPEMREKLEDEGLLMAMEEAKKDPANWKFTSLEDFRRERGL